MSEQETRKTVFMIYAGIRIGMSGDALASWYKLPDDWETNRPEDVESVPWNCTEDLNSRKKSVTRDKIVGYVYGVSMSEDGSSAYFGSCRSVRAYPDSDKRAEWYAMDRAARGALDAESFRERERKRDVDLECLLPLRRAYARLSFRERAALLVRVQQYLMRRGD